MLKSKTARSEIPLHLNARFAKLHEFICLVPAGKSCFELKGEGVNINRNAYIDRQSPNPESNKLIPFPVEDRRQLPIV